MPDKYTLTEREKAFVTSLRLWNNSHTRSEKYRGLSWQAKSFVDLMVMQNKETIAQYKALEKFGVT